MQDNLLILMEKQQQKSTHSKALEDSLNKTYTSEILQAVKWIFINQLLTEFLPGEIP